MEYINRMGKKAFNEAVGNIKDDDLTLETVLKEVFGPKFEKSDEGLKNLIK